MSYIVHRGRLFAWLAMACLVGATVLVAACDDDQRPHSPRLVDGSVRPAPAPPAEPPPPGDGYFPLRPVGFWSSLPDGRTCAGRVHRSAWEPRPDNHKRNHVMPEPETVHQAFSARPMAFDGSHDRRWDSWLLPRVDGQFTGTTDEIFQWAACKWGLADNVLRAVAYRESTWYQYATYPSGRPVVKWGVGDMIPRGTPGAGTYCRELAKYGYDYQRDFGPGVCPQTFSIVGIKSWHSPDWGTMPGNQNGTFPFNRDATSFAVDYLASQLRGCFEGWQLWLAQTGPEPYAAGDIWGCVGTWYAGAWHSPAANDYTALVQRAETGRVWLSAVFAGTRPACDPALGCPGHDPL